MASRRAGFTLMEMMVVIAIIGILAMMAVPSFQDRMVREQIVTALTLADIVKAPLALSWSTIQSFPADNETAGLPTADKIVNNYISSIAVRDGAIDITFGNHANNVIAGKILTLRAAVVEDAPIVPVTWVCGNATAPDKMTIKGENSTNIPINLLPFNCRAS